MTWRSIIRLAKKKYGVNEIIWVYNKKMRSYGKCNVRDKIIYLNFYKLRGNFELKINTIFHELGHIHCQNNNLWVAYHTQLSAQKVIRTGLKAERWVDEWGIKEMKKYFPEIKILRSYSKRHTVRRYRKFFLSYFRNKLQSA